uniref:Uncharacterized protein n=1 Tax=Romanomermis culicivorax TaxID=13658 RepID=A0A915IMS4_ROMCU
MMREKALEKQFIVWETMINECFKVGSSVKHNSCTNIFNSNPKRCRSHENRIGVDTANTAVTNQISVHETCNQPH